MWPHVSQGLDRNDPAYGLPGSPGPSLPDTFHLDSLPWVPQELWEGLRLLEASRKHLHFNPFLSMEILRGAWHCGALGLGGIAIALW